MMANNQEIVDVLESILDELKEIKRECGEMREAIEELGSTVTGSTSINPGSDLNDLQLTLKAIEEAVS